MEEIYILVGKIINNFQKLENLLFILLYIQYKNTNNYDKKEKKELRSYWANTKPSTLGQKLHCIKEISFFESENDIVVFEYLTTKRNYIAHEFFTDNEFDTEEDITNRKKELEQIDHDSAFIANALELLVKDRVFRSV